MEFKDRLRELREGNKMSAAQLAGAFEKSEGAVRMWETGRSKPDADTLIKLAEHFNCTTDYLLGISDFKNKEYADKRQEAENSIFEIINDLPIVIRSDVLFYLEQLLIAMTFLRKTEQSYSGILQKVLAILEHLPTFLITAAYVSDETIRAHDAFQNAFGDKAELIATAHYNDIDSLIDEIYSVMHKDENIITFKMKLLPDGTLEEFELDDVSEKRDSSLSNVNEESQPQKK